MKYCDFNTEAGYEDRIKCNEGYAKVEVKVFDNNDACIETFHLCRFCLERFMSEKMRLGLRLETKSLEKQRDIKTPFDHDEIARRERKRRQELGLE